MFDTTKSLKAVRVIKDGGRADLSRSQIVNLIVNMMDAMKKLPREDFKAVEAVYDYYRKFKTKENMDFDRYCEICKEIITDLDKAAPYEIYCGDVDVERFILHEIRKGEEEIEDDYDLGDEEDQALESESEDGEEMEEDLSEEEQIFRVMMEKYDLDEIGLTEEDMHLNARMLAIVSEFVHGKLTPAELDAADDFMGDVLDGTALKFAVNVPPEEYISTLVRALEHLDETKGKLTMEEKIKFAFCAYYIRKVQVYDPETGEVHTGLVDFDTAEHVEQLYQEDREMHPERYAFAEEDAEELDENEAPFGFSLENPIPVVSVSDAYEYLDSLRKPGYELHYMRKGAYDGPDGIVDKYLVAAQPEGTEPSETLPDFFEIYIYPYATKNSQRAPEGFDLAGENTPEEFELEEKNTVEEEPAADDQDAERYYFESQEEFITYSQKCDGSKNVIWLSGDAYLDKLKEGYDLIEENKPDEAVEALNEALKLNPIGISARFELCEAYIRLKKFSTAEKTLLNMKDMLTKPEHIAKFYRRLGFIQTDNYKNYAAAVACYLYSTKFEQNPTAIQELMYITQLGGKGALKKDPVKLLKKNNIPIIEA